MFISWLETIRHMVSSFARDMLCFCLKSIHFDNWTILYFLGHDWDPWFLLYSLAVQLALRSILQNEYYYKFLMSWLKKHWRQAAGWDRRQLLYWMWLTVIQLTGLYFVPMTGCILDVRGILDVILDTTNSNMVPADEWWRISQGWISLWLAVCSVLWFSIQMENEWTF